MPPPLPPREEAQHKPRPMTERERLYLERSGGCKACKAIHPLRLCPHPDAKRISQRFHEDRLKQQAAKRSREGHSGVTPDGKKPLLETGRTSPTPSTSGTSSSQARTDSTPPVKVTRKELIKASYSRVTSEQKLYLHVEGKPVKQEIFDDMRCGLYTFHANTIVKHRKDPNIHVPCWKGGLHWQKIGKDEHVVIGVATSKCLAEVEKWVKLSYPYLDCCYKAEDVPSTTFRFTGHLQGALVKKLDSNYFTTVLHHAVEERGIRGSSPWEVSSTLKVASLSSSTWTSKLVWSRTWWRQGIVSPRSRWGDRVRRARRTGQGRQDRP